jgi:hypothetical protein
VVGGGAEVLVEGDDVVLIAVGTGGPAGGATGPPGPGGGMTTGPPGVAVGDTTPDGGADGSDSVMVGGPEATTVGDGAWPAGSSSSPAEPPGP